MLILHRLSRILKTANRAGSLAGGAGSLAGSFKRKAELLELPTVTKRCKARLFSIALLFLSSSVSTTQQWSL